MKRLIQVGNSVALVIEKPILRRMSLGRGAIVEYQIQDGRLVVQRSNVQPPVLETTSGQLPPPKPKERMELVVRGLESVGIEPADVARLLGDKWDSTIHVGRAYLQYWSKASNGEFGELVELQLRTLLARRETLGMFTRVPFSETIDAILAELPELPPEDDCVRFEHLI